MREHVENLKKKPQYQANIFMLYFCNFLTCHSKTLSYPLATTWRVSSGSVVNNQCDTRRPGETTPPFQANLARSARSRVAGLLGSGFSVMVPCQADGSGATVAERGITVKSNKQKKAAKRLHKGSKQWLPK
jgi:hypothetical protein